MAAIDDLAQRARLIAAGREAQVPSPCVSVCRMDAASGLCEGCCRTLDEIAAWSQMDDEDKRAVWQLDWPASADTCRRSRRMKQITFFLDFVSPYSYLAFERLPLALQGLSYSVDYRPALFAGMLKQHGQLGPAEIAPKRDWTYRQVLWLAHQNGVALQMPAIHPFNPLALLRLALACGSAGSANRYVCETIFHHVWHGGADAVDAKRLAALTALLQPKADPAGEAVKSQLKSNTDERDRARRVRRADLCGGRQTVLGIRRAADAARLSGGRPLVQGRRLGRGNPGGRRRRAHPTGLNQSFSRHFRGGSPLPTRPDRAE